MEVPGNGNMDIHPTMYVYWHNVYPYFSMPNIYQDKFDFVGNKCIIWRQ